MNNPNSSLDTRSAIDSAINIINCYNTIYKPNLKFHKFIRLHDIWKLGLGSRQSKVNTSMLYAELDTIRIPLIKTFCYMVADTQGYILFNNSISLNDLYSLFPPNSGKLEVMLYMNFEFLLKSYKVNQKQVYSESQQDEDLLEMLLYMVTRTSSIYLVNFRDIQINLSNTLHKVNARGDILKAVSQIYDDHKEEDKYQTAEHIRSYIRGICIEASAKSNRTLNKIS